MDKEFYDLRFEEWMHGGNPDDLSEDTYDWLRNHYGYEPEEITCKDIGGKTKGKLWH